MYYTSRVAAGLHEQEDEIFLAYSVVKTVEFKGQTI